MSKYKAVFDAHPEAKEIFVAKDMPFLDKAQAESFAAGLEGATVKTVTRTGRKAKAPAGKKKSE